MATKRTVTLELPAGITSMEDMNEEQRISTNLGKVRSF